MSPSLTGSENVIERALVRFLTPFMAFPFSPAEETGRLVKLVTATCMSASCLFLGWPIHLPTTRAHSADQALHDALFLMVVGAFGLLLAAPGVCGLIYVLMPLSRHSVSVLDEDGMSYREAMRIRTWAQIILGLVFGVLTTPAVVALQWDLALWVDFLRLTFPWIQVPG
jgi:hypothetical protein